MYGLIGAVALVVALLIAVMAGSVGSGERKITRDIPPGAKGLLLFLLAAFFLAGGIILACKCREDMVKEPFFQQVPKEQVSIKGINIFRIEGEVVYQDGEVKSFKPVPSSARKVTDKITGE